MSTSRYARRTKLSLALMALSAPALLFGAARALEVNANSPLDWMPASFTARGDYERFRELFENGDVVVAGWPGCGVDDPRLSRFEELAKTSPAAYDSLRQPFFERVLTTRGTLDRLLAPPLSLRRETAIARLRGSLIGPDDRAGCAVVVFTPAGLAGRAAAVELLQTILERDCGIPRSEQHLAGPIIDGLTVDVASHEAMRYFAAPSSLLILLLAWRCLRSFRTALLVFAVAFYCQAASLALVYLRGDAMNAVLIVMPPLVLVLGVSGGIHLTNYLYDALRQPDNHDVAGSAVRLGWLPCALSSGTTAVGLASLLVSDVLPIRQFGFYGAFGVSATFFLLFLVLPGAFEIWPKLGAAALEQASLPRDGRRSPIASAPYSWRVRMAQAVARHRRGITWLSFAAMIAAACGIPKIQTSVRIQTLFAPESRILQDYAWLERHVVPLVPIEVLIHCNSRCRLSVEERLDLLRTIETRLRELPTVRATMSAATFAPDASAGTSAALREKIRRTVVGKKLEAALPQFIGLRYLALTGEEQAWRITARVGALENLDYGRFLDDARNAIEPVLNDYRARGVEGVSATYTGIMPLVHEVQRALMNDLFSSFLSALGVITAAMILVERRVMAGLISMIPNVFPIILLFGLWGWLGHPMDIGTVMTASIALGMAIDGTLHFLTFYRRDIRVHDSPLVAVRAAFEHCAGAMTESTVVCGFGLMIFAGSSFLPTSRFAWMILWLLWAALVGDLVVLPALLLGYGGRWFRRRTNPTPHESSLGGEVAAENPK